MYFFLQAVKPLAIGLATRRFLNTVAGHQINAAVAAFGDGLLPFRIADHDHYNALRDLLFGDFSYIQLIDNPSQEIFTKYRNQVKCQLLLDVAYLPYPYKEYEDYWLFYLNPSNSAKPQQKYYQPVYQKRIGPLKRAVENAAATTKATFSEKEVLTQWALLQQLMPWLDHFPERPREDRDYALAGVAHKLPERIVYLQDTFSGDITTLLRRFSIVLLDDLFDLVPPSIASLHENYSDKEIASLVDIQPLFLVQDVNDTLKRLEE